VAGDEARLLLDKGWEEIQEEAQFRGGKLGFARKDLTHYDLAMVGPVFRPRGSRAEVGERFRLCRDLGARVSQDSARSGVEGSGRAGGRRASAFAKAPA
jgi:hypothetical protein